MGITPETIEQYTKFMANKRLKEIGMQPLFEGFDSNPYKQLENIADTNGAGSVKGNFFEANVSSYNQSTAIEGWEEIWLYEKNVFCLQSLAFVSVKQGFCL